MSDTDTAAMPAGRALDALVAQRVLGYRHLVGDAVPEGLRHRDGPRGAPLPDQEVWVLEDRDYFCKWCGTLPPYSTDLAAAWTVVEHLGAQGWQLLLLRLCDGLTQASFSNQSVERHQAEAETTALAICRAALVVAEHQP